MNSRERQAIDLLGMVVSLRAGWRILLAAPAAIAVIVIIAFQLFPTQYKATAVFTVPSAIYARLISLEFQGQVAARVAEQGGTNQLDGEPLEPAVSPPTEDGVVAVSYLGATEADAKLHAQTFADMANELVGRDPATMEIGTLANLEEQIELDSYEAFNRRTSDALDAMLDHLRRGYGSGPFQSAPAEDIAGYVAAYRSLLDSLLQNSIYLETHRLRLELTNAELRVQLGRTELTVSPTARYRLLPVLLSAIFATFLLMVAFVIGRDSLLRAARS